MSGEQAQAFWNSDACVDMFAARDPDHRLVTLVEEYDDPSSVAVLDIGCAGGRNAVLLVEHGFEVTAIDFAPAMVERTRQRVRAIRPAAANRVLLARMDALEFAPDDRFDLVVALGVYQQAKSVGEWELALRETSRVLKTGGRCLVANFAPGTRMGDSTPELVPGSRFVYSGFRYGNACLLEPEALDEEFAAVGLVPETPTALVDRETPEGDRRRTVNALYRR